MHAPTNNKLSNCHSVTFIFDSAQNKLNERRRHMGTPVVLLIFFLENVFYVEF